MDALLFYLLHPTYNTITGVLCAVLGKNYYSSQISSSSLVIFHHYFITIIDRISRVDSFFLFGCFSRNPTLYCRKNIVCILSLLQVSVVQYSVIKTNKKRVGRKNQLLFKSWLIIPIYHLHFFTTIFSCR